MTKTSGLLLSLVLGLAARLAAEPAAPVALGTMFALKDLDAILAAARQQGLDGVPLYLGSYGIHAETSRAIATRLANGRYAPILRPARKNYPARKLHAWQLARLGAGAKAYDGPIPLVGALPPDEQYAWGLEMGRRLRDEIRIASPWVRIDAWQLDEVSHTASAMTPNSGAWREFLAGSLRGLAFGRPELGDVPMQGFVYIDRPARFAELPMDAPGVRRLYEEINAAALRVVGEEYPAFVGDPKEVARKAARGQVLLGRRGGIAGALARKYMAGLTPGHRLFREDGTVAFLGGNVQGKPDAWVERWRDAFIQERARIGVAGLGMYNWTKENSRPEVIEATARALARGLRLSARVTMLRIARGPEERR